MKTDFNWEASCDYCLDSESEQDQVSFIDLYYLHDYACEYSNIESLKDSVIYE